MKVVQTKEGVMLEIHAKPGSSNFRIFVDNWGLALSCTEEPVRGKVNKEIVKELSKLFHRKVELVSGFSSRQKRVLVVGAEKNEVERILLQVT